MKSKLKHLINYTKYAAFFFPCLSENPIYFVFFVTRNCNCICKHCLLGERRGEKNSKNELTLEEINKVSASMGRILFLLLTGGEPFLRKDLVEIVKIFYKNNHVQNVGIPTNGIMTDRILKSAAEILKSCPDLDFAIDISIDGICEDHDGIRGVPGLFEKAKRTYKELEKLKKRYKNFNLNIGLTVSSFNQNKLDAVLDYLNSELDVNTINYLLVRGKPRDSKSLNVKPELYKKFGMTLENFESRGTLSGYKNFPYSDFVNSIRKVRRKTISKILDTKKKQVTCFAARLGGVLQSNGDVFPCELLEKSMGNVRDNEYNFPSIWTGRKASEIRKWIKKSKCFCTYECFLTISIFFTPKMFCKVLFEWWKIKKQKKILQNK